MRRTRRHKLLQISTFFLIYSIIYVLSDNNNTAEHHPEEILIKNTKENGTDKEKDVAASSPAATSSTTTTTTTRKPSSTSKATTTTTTTTTTRKPPSSTTTEKTKSKNKQLLGESRIPEATTENSSLPEGNSTANSTIAPCIVPAIEQFPKPLIGPTGRKHGGIIIHILVAVYTFLGLAIVCDEYFVASLDRICEELKMSPDVAGATFMAAGSSAPELATVVIGVFFAKDDIGISGVIGSAVFNIMFVVSVCGLCTSTAVYLNWFPLIRDCFFYAVSILVMLITIEDELITWGESLFMLIIYVIYCVALHFNTFFEAWAYSLPISCKRVAPDEQSGLVTYKTLDEEKQKRANYGMSPEKPPEQDGFDSTQLSGPALNQASGGAPPPPIPISQDYYRPKEYDPSTAVDPLVKPADAGMVRQIFWAVVYPIHYMCRKTMPDCRTDQYKNWYPFTFFMSMLWISFYSYFMVWMITIIGATCRIPDTVMGLTFVAAGVSVPDALSSVAVIKEGYGDMAVSNAVGSNVFDILVCLGLPWFVKTAIIKPGSTVKVISKGLTYSTLSLLSTVVFLVAATHINGWKLDKKFGIVLMVWYLIFITFASMYELNVFGYLNPPECGSDY